MKSDGELMEILNAYDLTGSYRAAAELCGCSHHTVKKAVEDRNAGVPPATRRARMIDDWRDPGKMGRRFEGKDPRRQSPRTTAWRWDTPAPTAPPDVRWLRSNPNGDWAIHGCIGPGSPNPDCGCSTTSPTAARGRAASGAAVAWLAWCRYRVVIALRDRTAPSVFAGLDRFFRIVGGAPTYLLTDYVARHIIGLLCPAVLCARPPENPAGVAVMARVRAHNEIDGKTIASCPCL